MDMKRVEELKRKHDDIQNERINGKGMRYDKHARADEMAVNFEGAGYIDELFKFIKQQREQIEKKDAQLSGLILGIYEHVDEGTELMELAEELDESE